MWGGTCAAAPARSGCSRWGWTACEASKGGPAEAGCSGRASGAAAHRLLRRRWQNPSIGFMDALLQAAAASHFTMCCPTPPTGRARRRRTLPRKTSLWSRCRRCTPASRVGMGVAGCKADCCLSRMAELLLPRGVSVLGSGHTPWAGLQGCASFRPYLPGGGCLPLMRSEPLHQRRRRPSLTAPLPATCPCRLCAAPRGGPLLHRPAARRRRLQARTLAGTLIP